MHDGACAVSGHDWAGGWSGGLEWIGLLVAVAGFN